tara:strand:+ start:549 stop:860 length:312 start_codon:yes stop_codon:yes gene_type:complete
MKEYNLPIRLASTANLREHWAAKYKRTKVHKNAAIVIQKHPLPCTVEIIRVGKRNLDGDNLQNACKSLRDGIAARLGVDDADPRVTWKYTQQRGDYAAIVRIS